MMQISPHLPDSVKPLLWIVASTHMEIVPRRRLRWKTPYEIQYGRKPDLKRLEIYVPGATCEFGLTRSKRIAEASRRHREGESSSRALDISGLTKTGFYLGKSHIHSVSGIILHRKGASYQVIDTVAMCDIRVLETQYTKLSMDAERYQKIAESWAEDDVSFANSAKTTRPIRGMQQTQHAICMRRNNA